MYVPVLLWRRLVHLLVFVAIEFSIDGFMEDGDAESRFVASAGDADGDDCASAVFLEEWIERFQEERFCAGHGLGKLGLKAKMTGQIEVAAAKGIRSCKADCRSLNTERQAEKIDHTVFEMKTAVQIGDGTAGVLVLGLALTVAAQ